MQVRVFMKDMRWIKAFNDFFPLPMSAILWLTIAFVTSAIRNGWSFSLEYALFISVIIFNATSVSFIAMYLMRKGKASKILWRKIIISLVFSLLLNALLIQFANWKYLVAFIIIPLPLMIGLYFLFKPQLKE